VGSPSWSRGDGDGTGSELELVSHDKLLEIVLDNKIHVFGRAVQTDDEIAKKHATNATTIIFETQTINAFEIFLPSGVRTFSRLHYRERGGEGMMMATHLMMKSTSVLPTAIL
jgi:hypothetical protein